ncbi:hypothetical protein [Cetobacterium sp.]|uniref:hypothetical protein n=1 Tax=Cetobacterium sp. TaxID=2071632 RepID=UPI003F2C54DB
MAKKDRSETAIPCLIVFTKPLLLGGLPRNLFFSLLFIGFLMMIIFKNIIVGLLVFLVYIFLQILNKKDEIRVEGFFKMSRKKYISY